MARNMYGATSADFTLTSGGRVVPGATLTIWSARTGGTQITDLLDRDSVATTTVTSDADGSIVYYGPNNDTSAHWADSGVGSRIAIRPVNITGSAGPGSGILTTKGDILTRHTTADTRLGVGANGTVLVADSTQSTGLAWVTNGREWSGTGSPEGVVTAAPGSTWLQTDSTTDVKGWIRWVKATGTGNTGWVVGPEADTGWRDIASLLVAGLAVSSSEGLCVIRRRGTQVDVRAKVDCTSGSVAGLFAVPTGFLPTQDKRRQWPMFQASSAGAVLPPPVTANHFYMSVGNSTLGSIEYFPNPGTAGGSMSWETADAWPSSLPGSAA